jgi:glucan 1,3-beta-glucosidase
VIALAGGGMIGWAVALASYESLGIGGWLRSGALIVLAVLTPPVLAMVMVRAAWLPSFSDVLSGTPGAPMSRSERIAGVLVAAVTVIALQVAFGLVFDPRYKDFPFAPLTASILPVAMVALASRSDRRQGLAERVAAGALMLSAVYIFFNESVVNWQSVWLCLLLLLLSLSLVRFRWPRAAPG